MLLQYYYLTFIVIKLLIITKLICIFGNHENSMCMSRKEYKKKVCVTKKV